VDMRIIGDVWRSWEGGCRRMGWVIVRMGGFVALFVRRIEREGGIWMARGLWEVYF
jgi:hypothetical protein